MTSLEKKQTSYLVPESEIIESILTGKVSTAEELAKLHNLPLVNAVKILNDPVFLQTLSGFSKAKSNLHFHTKGVSKLIEIAESEDNKEAMSAIKMLATYTGNVKGNTSDVSVNINLENLIQREDEKEKKVNSPIIDLTEFDLK